jgi:integrase
MDKTFRVISEGTTRITKNLVETAWKQRAAGVRRVYRDDACRGLTLIVNPSSMAWSYSYRPRGIDPASGRRWPNKTITLGNPATLAPDAARHAAQAVKGKLASGGDPAADRERQHAEAQRQRSNTLARLADDYAKILPTRSKLRGAGALSPAHVKLELRALGAAIAEMKAETLPIEALTPASVRRMLAAHGAQPSAARARFGALSRFLDWALDDERITVNPCARISRAGRPKPPPARATYLTPAELAQLWRAAETLLPVTRDFARFLIAIPCRRGEATALDWRQLDLAGAAWSQPGKLTKNGDPHRLHLHPLALALLQRRHAEAGTPAAGLVFPAPRSGGLLTTWRDAKDELTTLSGVSGWTWHDMRRSFASALGEAGIHEAVADAVLNHRQAATRGGVLGVYQRAARWPEQCAAMVRWGELLTAAIAETADADRCKERITA